MFKLIKLAIFVVALAGLFIYFDGGSLLKNVGKKSVEVGDKMKEVKKTMKEVEEKAKDFSKDVSKEAKKKLKKIKDNID